MTGSDVTPPNKHKPAARAGHIALPAWSYKAMLVLAAAIWGLGTVVVKDTVDALPPLWLVGIRFFFSGLILLAVCFKIIRTNIDRESIVAGIFLGVFLAASYACNTAGLTDTTAAKSSFLTSTYCAFVPFFAWAISRIRPTRYNLAAVVLCIAGVGFVSFSDGFETLSFGYGEIITIVSAAFLALHIAFTAKLSDGRDALTLTVVQFLTSGVIGCIAGFLFEGMPDWNMLAEPAMLGNVAYIVVFASCIALSLQNIGVAHVAPAPAALFLATESVFGVIFSMAFLGETVTTLMVIGFVLIGAGIVVSEALPIKKKHLDANDVSREELRASEEG
ncbi:MAG: DMT family transporter [Slackia sp.]|nr:DMT family transporter [Slackia sp.]